MKIRSTSLLMDSTFFPLGFFIISVSLTPINDTLNIGTITQTIQSTWPGVNIFGNKNKEVSICSIVNVIQQHSQNCTKTNNNKLAN